MPDLQTQPPRLPQMRQSRYTPKEGEETTVALPGERTRAKIVRVVSDVAIIAELIRYTTSKDHRYQKGDYIPCRYITDGLNQHIWEAVDERTLSAPSTDWPAALPEPAREPEPFDEEKGSLNIENVVSDVIPEGK